jgi:hypothetical protein
MKTLLIIGALAFAVLLTGCSHKSATQTCVAGPGEICPSDIELEEDAEMKALDASFQKKLKAFQDGNAESRIRYNGLKLTLFQESPKDHTWDPDKRRWVTPPAQAATSNPTPAPVNPKGVPVPAQ